ncbi:hypothetical protein DV872_09455 [Oceanispirochaeta sp. M1]|nr:hypothetical protein DV872_09455 [Oceanispirochaeta sp. M1]
MRRAAVKSDSTAGGGFNESEQRTDLSAIDQNPQTAYCRWLFPSLPKTPGLFEFTVCILSLSWLHQGVRSLR